jgi:hypothetical protein
VVQRVRTKYHWPALQLNFWLLVMLVGSATILGIYASFLTVQEQLQVGIPWYVPLADPILPLVPLSPSFPRCQWCWLDRESSRGVRG